jgi:outer membrane protein assembly factor BamB
VELQFRTGRVFAATSEELFCFEYPSGVLLGRVRIPDKYAGRPAMVIERDHIFVGTSGELSCFDLNGRPLWVQPFEGMGFGSIALGFPGNVRQADDAGSK